MVADGTASPARWRWWWWRRRNGPGFKYRVVNGGMIVGGAGGNGGNGGASTTQPIAGGGRWRWQRRWRPYLRGAGYRLMNSGSIMGGSGGAGRRGHIGRRWRRRWQRRSMPASGAAITNNFGARSRAARVAPVGAFITTTCAAMPFDTNWRPCRPGSVGRGGTGISGSNLPSSIAARLPEAPDNGWQRHSFTGGVNTLTSNGTLTGNLGLADGIGTTLTIRQTAAAGATGNAIISGGITGISGAPPMRQ